jgi:hypothetical protein
MSELRPASTVGLVAGGRDIGNTALDNPHRSWTTGLGLDRVQTLRRVQQVSDHETLVERTSWIAVEALLDTSHHGSPLAPNRS